MKKETSPDQKQALLVCQNQSCGVEFFDVVDTALEGDAASLPLALKAHKAGWLVIDGKILCPHCATSAKRQD